MHVLRLVILVGFYWLSLSVSAFAQTEMASVDAAVYGEYSVSAPSPAGVTICHGFGCKFRNEVAFSGRDRARLAGLLASGRGSPAAERRAVGAAGAWYDRRIAAAAGTKGHVARAGTSYSFDTRGQFDCIDASRNTTSLLVVLEQLDLLRHHKVANPVARGYLFDGRPPHVTAVLVETGSGKEWAVDSWTRGYGKAPEIMPLSQWMDLN